MGETSSIGQCAALTQSTSEAQATMFAVDQSKAPASSAQPDASSIDAFAVRINGGRREIVVRIDTKLIRKQKRTATANEMIRRKRG